MHRGYNLELTDGSLDGYVNEGRSAQERNKKVVRAALSSLTDASGRLVAEKINARWFPEIEASVFISHSHKDSDLALALSGFLQREFQLTSFVDSTAWGFCEDLLRQVDEEYCLNRDRTLFDYKKRNRSTAHVYMMVSVALCRMIDRCECVFFVNTPRSIDGAEYIRDSSTGSPWIYSEIAMTGLVRARSADEHRAMRKATAALKEDLEVRYSVDMGHLTKLGSRDLTRWRQDFREAIGAAALDGLYAMK